MSSPKEMLEAIGALAELAGYMRDQLMKNGFTRAEATVMVSEYIRNTMFNKEDK